MKKLPNLELLSYKAQQILLDDENFIKIISQRMITGENFELDFDINVFPQTWPQNDGKSAYTTVIHEIASNMYVVFIDDIACYLVTEASAEFLKDLHKRQLKSYAEASKYYL